MNFPGGNLKIWKRNKSKANEKLNVNTWRSTASWWNEVEYVELGNKRYAGML